MPWSQIVDHSETDGNSESSWFWWYELESGQIWWLTNIKGQPNCTNESIFHRFCMYETVFLWFGCFYCVYLKNYFQMNLKHFGNSSLLKPNHLKKKYVISASFLSNTTQHDNTITNCGRRCHNFVGCREQSSKSSCFQLSSRSKVSGAVKQRRESYLCSPNRGAVSDVCGWGGGRGFGDWIEGAFVWGGGVTPWREVLPLHSAVVDGCLLVGAGFRNFISCVWVHWMRPFPPLQQETSNWVPPFKRFTEFGPGSHCNVPECNW